MNTLNMLLFGVVVSIFLVLVVIGCRDDTRMLPTDGGHASEVSNFYMSRGDYDYKIAVCLYDNELVVNLPLNIWKITYWVEGAAYEVCVKLHKEIRVYIGTFARTERATLQEGRHRDPNAPEGRFDPSDFISGDMEPIEIVIDGTVAPEISTMSDEICHPTEQDSPIPATPVVFPVITRVWLLDQDRWILPHIKGDTPIRLALNKALA